MKKTRFLQAAGIWTLLLFFAIISNILILSYASIRETSSLPLRKGTRHSLVFSPVQLDSIEQKFGTSLEILPEYRRPILTALSYYPDLIGVSISFKYSEEATTMASRPKLSSLFSSKRKYCIYINKKENFEGILLVDIPPEAQVGIIGHEIAHIAEYERRNLFGIIQLGTMYLTDRGKQSFEKETDRQTIERGLGWQLLEWAQYAMYDSPKASPAYKEFKRRIYMSPKEIEEQINLYSYRYAL